MKRCECGSGLPGRKHYWQLQCRWGLSCARCRPVVTEHAPKTASDADTAQQRAGRARRRLEAMRDDAEHLTDNVARH